jgi:hypothetical protein
MPLANDGYVAVKGVGGKITIKKLIGDKRKEHFVT